MVQVENHDWKIDGILPAKHIPAKQHLNLSAAEIYVGWRDRSVAEGTTGAPRLSAARGPPLQVRQARGDAPEAKKKMR